MNGPPNTLVSCFWRQDVVLAQHHRYHQRRVDCVTVAVAVVVVLVVVVALVLAFICVVACDRYSLPIGEHS